MTRSSETLYYGIGESALGSVLAAHSARGVAALFLGDDPARLVRDLKASFPGRALVLDRSPAILAKAIALIEAPHLPTDLVLDPEGSPLELTVWRALQAIPAGETRTYGAIAKSLALPATAQEVGAACAANRIAVAVPCHRVLKSDGSIAGYRWGVWRKRRLLARESAAASNFFGLDVTAAVSISS